MPSDVTSAGFVRLFRSVWEDPLFDSYGEASIFAWMISTAQWRDAILRTKVGPVPLRKGELIIAERVIAAKFGMHRNIVRKVIRRLVDRNSITIKRDHRGRQVGTIVQIVNYELYQGVKQESDEAENQGRDQGGTKARPRRDQGGTENNESKKRKKEKNGLPSEDSPMSPPAGFQPDLLNQNVVGLVVPPDLPHRAMELWNDMATRHDLAVVKLDKASEIYKARRLRLMRLLDELERHNDEHTAGLTALERFKLCIVDQVAGSRFCQGYGEHGWKISLDAICKLTHVFSSLLDGRYAERAPAAKPKTNWELCQQARDQVNRELGFTSDCDSLQRETTFDGLTIDHLEVMAK